MTFKEPFLISSAQNAKIKEVINLRDKRNRDKTGLFLIEGYREILRAVEAGRKMEQLFICPELFLGSNEESLIAQIQNKGTIVFTSPKALFQKLSYRDRPDGLLAVSKQTHVDLAKLNSILEQKKAPLFVVAESIEKPGNLGTILRSSDAVGVDALILCDRCTDIHNPNVVRASVGTLFTVPVVETTGKEALQWLKSKGIATLAATPHATGNFTDVDMRGPIAIILGTEQFGLSDLWMNEADIQVRIPMMGVADSLNVAMAATLLMYEALRQRSGGYA